MTRALTTLGVLIALTHATAQVPEAWKDWPPEVFDRVEAINLEVTGRTAGEMVIPVDLNDVQPVKVELATGLSATRTLLLSLVQSGAAEEAARMAERAWQQTGPTAEGAALQVAFVEACANRGQPSFGENAVARLREGYPAELSKAALALGNGYLRAQLPEHAVEHFKAVRSGATDPAARLEAMLGAGRAYLLGRDYRQAVQVLDQAIAANPSSDQLGWALFLKGGCAHHQNDYAGAVPLYRSASAHADGMLWRKWLLSDLAHALFMSGQYEQCVDAATQYLTDYGSQTFDQAALWSRSRAVAVFATESLSHLGEVERADAWLGELPGKAGDLWAAWAMCRRARLRMPTDRVPTRQELAAFISRLSEASQGRPGTLARLMARAEIGWAHWQGGDLASAEAALTEGINLCQAASAKSIPPLLVAEELSTLQRYLGIVRRLRDHPLWVALPDPEHRDWPTGCIVDKPALQVATTRGQPGRSSVTVLALRSPGEDPALEVLLDRPHLSVRVVRDDSPVSFASAYTLEIEASGEMPPGQFSGEAIVKSPNLQGYALKLPWRVTVVPVIRHRPSQAFFGIVNRGTGRSARVVLVADQPFTVESVETGLACLTAAVDSAEAAVRHEVTLEYRPQLNDAPGPSEGRLAITAKMTPDSPEVVYVDWYAQIE
ncbi:MAG: tetratricopeptide repeat protein [Armatimonadetes bacterium]|nr:tetratricopeptide repeat protein [Armatimonadota bacterium]